MRFLLCIGLVAFVMQSHAQQNQLWFSKPATNWNEALPIGNGRLGAMVFGNVSNERLQLNEESVWSGKREDFVNPEALQSLPKIRSLLFEGKYAEAQALAQRTMMGNKKIPSSYQTLGDLFLEMDHPEGEVKHYTRTLDLQNAVASVRYQVGDVVYTREYFSSAPAQALVVRLTASKPEVLNFSMHLSRQGNLAEICNEGNTLIMREHTGNGVGIKLVARANILNEGGSVSETSSGKMNVEGATSVTIVLTAATDYWGGNPETISASELDKASAITFEKLKEDHIKDYRKFFDRVSFVLGEETDNQKPTDERLKAVQNGGEDHSLIPLYYQFGRYLLISSSRPGGLPANLQGIWADGLNPPWDADYHININIQMNYWPAGITNLSEMEKPFLEFLDVLREDGRKTAKAMYGVEGAVAHFTTDAWHFTEPYGETQWAMWPMGLAWSAHHAWEHFLFTGDTAYLKKAYPIMKDAAEFSINFLVENPQTKKLVSGPSISPENTFKTKEGKIATMVMGPTMDHMIIRDLLQNTNRAAQLLQQDKTLQKKIASTLKKLAPIEISSDGRIMEWTEEFEEAEPGHRHISHLYALHPGNQITRHTPDLYAAARKTIDQRLANGGGHTGWSRAWIINFFARLHDGEAAYENLQALLKKSTLPNLFDTHPPFQIDGNFGATAGITEMLLQSHANEVELLPALPSEWKEGHIRGICARGGFELDIVWENGILKSAKVFSKLGSLLVLRYGDTVVKMKTEKGKAYSFDSGLTLVK